MKETVASCEIYKDNVVWPLSTTCKQEKLLKHLVDKGNKIEMKWNENVIMPVCTENGKWNIFFFVKGNVDVSISWSDQGTRYLTVPLDEKHRIHLNYLQNLTF